VPQGIQKTHIAYVNGRKGGLDGNEQQKSERADQTSEGILQTSSLFLSLNAEEHIKPAHRRFLNKQSVFASIVMIHGNN
jgi:hypothetical protein